MGSKFRLDNKNNCREKDKVILSEIPNSGFVKLIINEDCIDRENGVIDIQCIIKHLEEVTNVKFEYEPKYVNEMSFFRGARNI